jgi:hypothetical protein
VIGSVFPPGSYPRLPIASADIYVDRKDSSKFVKVLHFGLQNLYDPRLDEWIVIDKADNEHPGDIHLPFACWQTPPTAGATPSLQQFASKRAADLSSKAGVQDTSRLP